MRNNCVRRGSGSTFEQNTPKAPFFALHLGMDNYHDSPCLKITKTLTRLHVKAECYLSFRPGNLGPVFNATGAAG